MRIHVNKLTETDLRGILDAEKAAGHIASVVGFKALSSHRSRSHDHAFEVQLDAYAKEDGDGRRRGNSGSYGGGENWAATYDEWGWFLAALFDIEDDANATYYADADDFHHKTSNNYRPATYKPVYGDDEYPWIVVGGRGGKTGDMAGRLGARYANKPRWGNAEFRPRWINGKRVEAIARPDMATP